MPIVSAWHPDAGAAGPRVQGQPRLYNETLPQKTEKWGGKKGGL